MILNTFEKQTKEFLKLIFQTALYTEITTDMRPGVSFNA